MPGWWYAIVCAYDANRSGLQMNIHHICSYSLNEVSISYFRIRIQLPIYYSLLCFHEIRYRSDIWTVQAVEMYEWTEIQILKNWKIIVHMHRHASTCKWCVLQRTKMPKSWPDMSCWSYGRTAMASAEINADMVYALMAGSFETHLSNHISSSWFKSNAMSLCTAEICISWNQGLVHQRISDTESSPRRL